LIVQRYWSFI